MDCSCNKFGDFSFSRFGLITQTHTELHTNATKHFTPVTDVGVSNDHVHVSH